MKKLIPLTFVAAFLLALVSCGESYTPLTDEEIQTKAEEEFETMKEGLEAKFEEKCTSIMDSLVEAKMN